MRRLLPVVIIFALVSPSAASAADTLTITPPASAAAETTVPVVLAGSTEAEENELAKLEVWAVRNASACEVSSFGYLLAGDPGTEAFLTTSGAFSRTLQLTIRQSGAYLLCGYLDQSLDKVMASAAMTVGPSSAELEAQAKHAAEVKALAEAQDKQATEAAEAQAKNASEAQTKAAEAKAKELAEQAPATFLSVKTVSHRLGSTEHPGATKFEIGTSRYAYVTITTNDGWTRQYRASGKTQDVTFNWSCRHPGTRRYVVTAVGGAGLTFSRSGHFKTITNSWCASTKKGEEEANRDVREEERHEAEQERRRAEEKHRQEVERFDSNCEKLGGKPIELPTSEGLKIYCRGPNGGVIPVPH
jgi:hypothetical protein